MFYKRFTTDAKETVVHWSLTNRCNLNCPYCIAEDRKTRSKAELETPALDHILENLHHAYHEKLIFQLQGGEPLLFKNLNYLLNQISDHPTYLITNGQMGDELESHLKSFPKLKAIISVHQNGLERIQASMPWISKQFGDRIQYRVMVTDASYLSRPVVQSFLDDLVARNVTHHLYAVHDNHHPLQYMTPPRVDMDFKMTWMEPNGETISMSKSEALMNTRALSDSRLLEFQNGMCITFDKFLWVDPQGMAKGCPKTSQVFDLARIVPFPMVQRCPSKLCGMDSIFWRSPKFADSIEAMVYVSKS